MREIHINCEIDWEQWQAMNVNNVKPADNFWTYLFSNLKCDTPVEWSRVKPTVTTMASKLNKCPRWGNGHHGNGWLESADSIWMPHDVAVHIIVTARETWQQKNKRTQRYWSCNRLCGWCCRNKTCGCVARLGVLRSKCKKNKFFVIDHTVVWTNVKIATGDLLPLVFAITIQLGLQTRKRWNCNSDDLSPSWNMQENQNHWTSQGSTQLNLDAEKFQMETVAIDWSVSAADIPTHKQRCAWWASSQRRDTSSCVL